MHVDCTMRGGIVVATYFQTGESFEPETGNWQRFLSIGDFLRSIGRPYIVGADWNAAAKAIDESGWPASLQGRFVQVEGIGTCRSAEGGGAQLTTS